VQESDQIRLSAAHLPNLEVDSFDGLTVNYAQMRQAQVLLKFTGFQTLKRNYRWYTNKTLSTQIETVFLATSNEYSFLSSSLVKEIANLVPLIILFLNVAQDI